MSETKTIKDRALLVFYALICAVIAVAVLGLAVNAFSGASDCPHNPTADCGPALDH